MRNSKFDNRSGGDNRRGGKKFGGGRRDFDRRDDRRGGRDEGRPAMHQTTCDECGQSCEVPFKPSGDKPVFCSDCFSGKRDKGSQRSDRRDFDRRDDRRGGRDEGRPAMHQTTCDECGQSCEVPFKPSGDKPVFCDDCFGKNSNKGRGGRGGDRNRGGSNGGSNKQLEEQFKALNAKLDKILNALSPVATKAATKKEVTPAAPKEKIKKIVEEAKKSKPKKAATKKTVAKKAKK